MSPLAHPVSLSGAIAPALVLRLPLGLLLRLART